MGGFTEQPPPEAVDLPPENAFDVQAFSKGVIDQLRRDGVIPKDLEGILDAAANPTVYLLTVLAALAFPMLMKLLRMGIDRIEPAAEELVTTVTEILDPVMLLLGKLTNAYVRQVSGRGSATTGAGLPIPAGSQQDAVSTVFDQIMAPMLNLLTPSNPGTAGAGENNARHIMGTIISLHLSTWAVNIISNFTGLGYLKFINSFDDAITSGISARGFSRLASKPYLDKYVVKPLTKDLNRAWPLETGSAGALVKRYIRGNMTAEELKYALRKQGFDDEVVADMLLDTVKLFSMDMVVDFVNDGMWDEDQALEHLKQQGWPAPLAPMALWHERNARVRAQMYSLASSLTEAFIDRRIDNPTLRHMLEQAGLPKDEIQAYSTRGAVLQELPRRLSLGQVQRLFGEDLVDLDYVMNYLRDENYSDQDVDLLALLEFTRKEDREQRRADLLERRRVALEAQLGFEAEADRARLAELAALGGPTP